MRLGRLLNKFEETEMNNLEILKNNIALLLANKQLIVDAVENQSKYVYIPGLQTNLRAEKNTEDCQMVLSSGVCNVANTWLVDIYDKQKFNHIKIHPMLQKYVNDTSSLLPMGFLTSIGRNKVKCSVNFFTEDDKKLVLDMIAF